MIVRNIGAKVIGFGKTIITPGETAKLPHGFDESHPVVEFYVSHGFLEKAEGTERVDQVKSEADEADKKAEELGAKLKALSAMKREELVAAAAELGIEASDADTKDALKQKITEKYQSE